MCSAVAFLPSSITLLTTWDTSFDPYSGSGSSSRTAISARRGMLSASLRAVLGARLAAVGDAAGIEGRADHLVAEAREILDATAADEDDRVLLEVVSLAGNVGADFHLVRQPDARDLAQRGVRLLRRRRVHARADPPLLRGASQGGSLDLGRRGLATLPHELIHGRHAAAIPWLSRCLWTASRRNKRSAWDGPKPNLAAC